MDFIKDPNAIFYIGIIIILLILTITFKIKNGIIFKVLIRFILGGAFIFLFNFSIAKLCGISIPFNLITTAIIGFLELPGFIFIFIIKYVIYPI